MSGSACAAVPVSHCWKADGIVCLPFPADYRSCLIGLVVQESTQSYPQYTGDFNQWGKRRNVDVLFDAAHLFHGQSGAFGQFLHTYFLIASERFDFFSDDVCAVHRLGCFEFFMFRKGNKVSV